VNFLSPSVTTKESQDFYYSSGINGKDEESDIYNLQKREEKIGIPGEENIKPTASLLFSAP
jgi:hypothetical protein